MRTECAKRVSACCALFGTATLCRGPSRIEAVVTQVAPARGLNESARFSRSNESMDNTRVFRTSFASVYPHYITKAEKKSRTKEEVHAIIPHSRVLETGRGPQRD